MVRTVSRREGGGVRAGCSITDMVFGNGHIQRYIKKLPASLARRRESGLKILL